MLQRVDMVDDEFGIASPAEVARALGVLSVGELRRLELIARGRANGLVGADWSDLLQEAVARALEGSRRWPRAIPIMAFLAQTIRSIASELRSRAEAATSDRDTDAQLSEDPRAGIEAADLLRRIRERFQGDEKVAILMDGILAGETARETQIRSGMSSTEYDAARKRFWRGLPSVDGE